MAAATDAKELELHVTEPNREGTNLTPEALNSISEQVETLWADASTENAEVARINALRPQNDPTVKEAAERSILILDSLLKAEGISIEVFLDSLPELEKIEYQRLMGGDAFSGFFTSEALLKKELSLLQATPIDTKELETHVLNAKETLNSIITKMQQTMVENESLIAAFVKKQVKIIKTNEVRQEVKRVSEMAEQIKSGFQSHDLKLLTDIPEAVIAIAQVNGVVEKLNVLKAEYLILQNSDKAADFKGDHEAQILAVSTEIEVLLKQLEAINSAKPGIEKQILISTLKRNLALGTKTFEELSSLWAQTESNRLETITTLQAIAVANGALTAAGLELQGNLVLLNTSHQYFKENILGSFENKTKGEAGEIKEQLESIVTNTRELDWGMLMGWEIDVTQGHCNKLLEFHAQVTENLRKSKELLASAKKLTSSKPLVDHLQVLENQFNAPPQMPVEGPSQVFLPLVNGQSAAAAAESPAPAPVRVTPTRAGSPTNV